MRRPYVMDWVMFGCSVLLITGIGSLGCARERHTVRTDTTVVQPSSSSTTGAVITEEHTVHSHVETEEPRRGFLSGLVHVVGEIIALPFRLVAGLFEAIF